MSVLKNALLLDTETTGLTRGSGIFELAFFNPAKKHVQELLLSPNWVGVTSPITQDVTGLASSPMDTHRYMRESRWLDVFKAQMIMSKQIQPTASDTEVLKALAWSNKFTSSRLSSTYKWLLKAPPTPLELRAREQALGKLGVTANSQYMSPEQAFGPGGALERILKAPVETAGQGRTLWIANAPFEAKQIGAQLAGLGETGHIKDLLETSSKSPDPFYVTGEAVNRARVVARRTGDWTGVWRSYGRNVPKAGEIAVRDIMDVARSTLSYGQKLGMLDEVDTRHGLGQDILHRLLGAADLTKSATQRRAALGLSEVHSASWDVAQTEAYNLQRLSALNDAAEAALSGSTRGQELIAQAQAGKGPLAEMALFSARHKSLRDVNLTKSMYQRMERAIEDLETKGGITAQVGERGIVMMEQATPGGGVARVPRINYERRTFKTLDEYTDFLKERKDFEGLDLDAAVKELREASAGDTPTARMRGLKTAMSAKMSKLDAGAMLGVDDKFTRELADIDVDYFQLFKRQGHVATRAANLRAAASKVIGAGGSKLMVAAGGAMAMVAGMGLIAGKQVDRPESSIVSYNYDKWLAHRNAQTGMGHTGLAGYNRGLRTDFGSPYNGPMGSMIVFHDQALLAERERFLRSQYGAVHYDPEFGVFAQLKTLRPLGNTIPAGQALSGDYAGLRKKKSLREIDVSQGWKMTVEDADTVVIQRGGIRGAITSFFGMNKRYSFRLAGIDSTEVTHGPWSADSGQYHGNQPYGQEATEAARQMLAEGKVKIVFDPTNTTYGRAVAALYVDGQNYNIEAVKRGYAAFLPFGKRSESMIDWNSMEGAQTRAMDARRGMWSQPWAQVYGEYYKAGHNSITFNTFTRKDRIVKSQSTMDLLSLMEQAQSQGMMSNAHAIEATRLSRVADTGTTEFGPAFTGVQHQAHYNSYISAMASDTGRFMRTKGRGGAQNKFKHRGGYGKLDAAMAIDTMGTTNSVWTKRRSSMVESYGLQSVRATRRRTQMAEMQRRVSQNLFDSPINHHVM